LTAPGAISNDTATRLKDYWDTNFTGDNVGKVAVLGDGLKYEGMAWNAVDLQLVEQLRLTGEIVCTCYHVDPYLVGIGPPPPYANVEPVIQKYYSQCLQSHFNQMELALDDGLGLGKKFGNNYGTEFDPDDLIWMDAAAKSKAALDGIGSGGMSPNEARKRYYALGPVPGGNSPYLQQQYYSLEALAKRDADDPFAKPAPHESQLPMPEDAAAAADNQRRIEPAKYLAYLKEFLRNGTGSLTIQWLECPEC
jgi:phage portal protein BeeE